MFPAVTTLIMLLCHLIYLQSLLQELELIIFVNAVYYYVVSRTSFILCNASNSLMFRGYYNKVFSANSNNRR